MTETIKLGDDISNALSQETRTSFDSDKDIRLGFDSRGNVQFEIYDEEGKRVSRDSIKTGLLSHDTQFGQTVEAIERLHKKSTILNITFVTIFCVMILMLIATVVLITKMT